MTEKDDVTPDLDLAVTVGGPDEHCPTSKDAAMIHCNCWYDNCKPCCWCGDATPDDMCDCERCSAARSEAVSYPKATTTPENVEEPT